MIFSAPVKNLNRERSFILFAVLFITLLGTLMIYESSSIQAYKIAGDAAYFFKRQILFFLIGLGVFFLTLLVDLDFLKRYNKELLIMTIVLLVLVLFVGKKVGGARRWFSIAGINFQPSEILKITFLLYCADYFKRKKAVISNFQLGLIPLGAVLGLICFLLLLEPDLGTAVFWILWTFLFLYLYKAKKWHLIGIMSAGLVLGFFLIKLYPYRLRRITAYLNPFADPKGAGFQLIQAQIAYGQGGIMGVGLGEGKQKLFFLPAAHTDFIFSIIAEEFGLWGTLGIIFIFCLILHKMFNVARRINNEFRRGILLGIIFIFALEVIINIGVSCGLFPTKGLPLPFMSYGGSQLVTHFCLLGLFFNASRPAKRAESSSK